jgi:hypothetical protein
MYRQALERGPEIGSIHANLASLLITEDRHEEAERHVSRALEHTSSRPDRIRARVHVLDAVLHQLRGENWSAALGSVKTLIANGIEHAPWSVVVLKEYLADRLPSADHALLVAVIGAMDSYEGVGRLEDSEAWEKLQSVPSVAATP